MNDNNCNDNNCNQPADYGRYEAIPEVGCNGCEGCVSCGGVYQPLPDYEWQEDQPTNCEAQKVIPWWEVDDTPYNLSSPFEPYEAEDDCYQYKMTTRDKVFITNKQTGVTTIKQWTNPSQANAFKIRVLDSKQNIDQTLDIPSNRPIILQAGANVKLDPINNTNPANQGVKISVKLPNNPIYGVLPSTGLNLDEANRFSINPLELKTNLGLVTYAGGQLKDANNNIISIGNGTLLGLQNVISTTSGEIEVTASSSVNTLQVGVNTDKLKTKCGIIDAIKVGSSFVVADAASHKIEIVTGAGLIISQGANSNQISITVDVNAMKTLLGIGSTNGSNPTLGLGNSIAFSLARSASVPRFDLTGGNIPANTAAICTIPTATGNVVINGLINASGAFVPATGSIVSANASIGSQNFVITCTSVFPNPQSVNILTNIT